MTCPSSAQQVAEDVEDTIQEIRDIEERSASIQKTDHGAEKIADQVSGAGHGIDVENDLVQVDGQPALDDLEKSQRLTT